MITNAQIRAARALLGWKQTELATAARLSEMSVKNIERGDTDPRVSTLHAIKVCTRNCRHPFHRWKLLSVLVGPAFGLPLRLEHRSTSMNRRPCSLRRTPDERCASWRRWLKSGSRTLNSIPDLLASARTVHDRYKAGQMERETVREWIGRLGTYDGPTGERVRAAVEWFRINNGEPISEEIRHGDVQRDCRDISRLMR